MESAEQDDILTLEIFPSMSLSTLRESIQAETQIPPTSQHLYHNGNLIAADQDAKTMADLGISDNDMLAVHVRDVRQPDQSTRGGGQQRRNPGSSGQDPELIRLRILGDPRLRAQAQQQQPQLAAVLDDPQRFAQMFNESLEREQRERDARQRELARLNEDPFDVEAQQKIEEMIRQERVMENLQNAMEHNPEDKLIIQGIEIPFLGEADIPKESEEALEQEPRLPGPAGTTIGQRSGVVSGPHDAPTEQPSGQGTPAAAAPPPATSSAPVASQPATPSFPEESIKQLMDLGFPRQAAIEALQATGGNVEFAAGLLFGA
ncbi:hypothetical protein ACRALDRAFT_1072081 [Sodiomyces alcalophilus JCM 7366]|uniref:uncharacterized protein n=1 Tax=Sodiomyces alcalophilus JCM 7366 TaxID=591952 RepID=UPI0039B54241